MQTGMSKNPKQGEILSLLCIGVVSTHHRCLTVHLPLFAVAQVTINIGESKWSFSETVSSGRWSLLKSPSSWHGDDWERKQQLRLSVLPCIQHGPLGELLASPASQWLLVFSPCLALSNLSKFLKPLKVFETELKGRLLSLSNVGSKAADTYRN